MSNLDRGRYASFAVAALLLGALVLFHFARVAHAPSTPDSAHPYQLFFDPQTYVTQTDAIVGYALFACSFPACLVTLLLTAAYIRATKR